jgi:hypothetical protein
MGLAGEGPRGDEVGTIRRRQGERVVRRRPDTPLGGCSIDRPLSAWASKEPGQHQVERLHAVPFGRVVCSIVHAGVVRGCVGREAGLFRPRARQNRCRPARPAVMSEQSRGRNNRCCSDLGTTPILLLLRGVTAALLRRRRWRADQYVRLTWPRRCKGSPILWRPPCREYEGSAELVGSEQLTRFRPPGGTRTHAACLPSLGAGGSRHRIGGRDPSTICTT